MSELAHQAESIAESARNMTLVLKTLVPILLVAVVLQLGAAITPPHWKVSLNMVLGYIDKITGTLTTQDFYVEDVDTSNCGAAFFCKVQDILQHNNFTKLVVNGEKDGENITKNLKSYLNLQNVNCSLQDVRPSNISKPLSVLLKNVATCIRHHNFQGYR